MPKYGKCLKVMKHDGQVLKILPVPRERQLKPIKVQKEVLSAESWRETAVYLLSQQGPGIINRIWLTVSKRNPKMLRALRIKFYWDNSVVPAVDVPLGDFLGIRCHVHLVLRTVSFLIRRSVLLTVVFRCLTAPVPKWCL